MYMIAEVSQYVAVASFAEAWIEIILSREQITHPEVASFAEAWIEIVQQHSYTLPLLVASFAEARIVIILSMDMPASSKSPPSRRCGLKYLIVHPTN